ncbi:MAG: GNAT family N-acetyltransferase [bacterium]|nr:GNAT family N-acetyltransferase [bacterium]
MLVTGELTDALSCPGINSLVKDLSKNAEPITVEELERGIKQPNFHLMAVWEDKTWPEIFGMAVIFFVWRPEGWTGQIHSVVVGKQHRGKGIGGMLMNALLQIAGDFSRLQNKKIKVELTSNPNNPDRAAAIKMYEKYGFKLVAQSVDEHGTNLYRLVVAP